MTGTDGVLSDLKVSKNKPDDLKFYVNGKKICLGDANPEITLSVFLRRHLRLTGTKMGCDEGACGSCTVMVSDYDTVTESIRHKSVTSCLVPICGLHGMAVTTIEALGNLKSGLNPIQERLVKYHGTQCGFCSPGMVMSMYTLLRNNPHPTLEEITNNLQDVRATGLYWMPLEHLQRHKSVTSCLVPICGLHGMAVTTIEALGNLKSGLNPIQERLVKYHGTQCGFCSPGMVMSMYTLLRNNPHPTLEEITNNLQGNVCRCTGYRSILDAFGTFAKENCCAGQDGCCPLQDKGGCCLQGANNCQDKEQNSEQDKESVYEWFDQSQPAIQLDPSQELIFPPELKLLDRSGRTLCFDGPYVRWYRPGCLRDALEFLSSEPQAIVAAGFTNIVQKLKGSVEKQVVVDVSDVQELKGHTLEVKDMAVGSGLTMSEVIHLAEKHRNKSGVSSILLAIPQALESWHTQLKNSATLGGHIMLRTPQYDLLPLFIAGQCYLNIASKDQTRSCPINGEFLENKGIIKQNEIVTSISFPCLPSPQFVRTYRVAKRKHQAFASLSAAFVLDLSPNERLKLNGAKIVFGGDITKVVVAKNTQMYISGRTVTESSLTEALTVLKTELSTSGFSDTQIQWAQGFLTKCLLEIMAQTAIYGNGPNSQLKFESKQFYEISKEGEFSQLDIVGQPMTHSSAEEQATGEAIFIDDIAPSVDELFVQPVLSTRAHATITAVDLEAALALPGVHGYVDSTDVPGVNSLVPRYREEELFATNTIHHYGQIILGIVADNRETAMKAASLVKISYEDKQPVIFSIKEAIAAGAYLCDPGIVKRGDTEAGFGESDAVLEGELYLPGQKHMYMETNVALAVPKERGEIEVLSGTQLPHLCQSNLAEILSVASHKVCVRTKRMGGAFGGKETRSFLAAFPAAVAAVKFRRPVRCVLTRRDDMQTNGGRHPVFAKYKVGFKNNGKVLSLEWTVYLDGGCSVECSKSVMDLLMLRGDTTYNIPSVKIEARVCRTNSSSKGAFRGFGVPQIYWLMENVITAIATKLSSLPEKIREVNMYDEGQTTLSDVLLKPCTLKTCWEECKTMSKFEQRLKEIQEFNRKQTHQKRGLSMTSTMFGIGIFPKFLNQAGALVNVYTDGSVLVTHGGCEMGQGLHTKIKQIASEALGIDYNKVVIGETSTNFVPNTTPSGASFTTDINGGAVYDACQILLERLRPFREEAPSAGWDKWVNEAYFNRVNLSATGFCKFGDFNYDFKTGKGPDCMYNTYGAGCSEVELDCLTGEHKLLRTDIVMDVGRSLNPAIDIGQIEGAFVQGYGHLMLEDVVHTDEGRLLTASPLTYKVPLCSDIPTQFNVALLKNSTNDKAIYSSKGIGEPPLLLSLSAYLALKEAVKSAREDKGLEKTFVLESPAIPANVLKFLS